MTANTPVVRVDALSNGLLISISDTDQEKVEYTLWNAARSENVLLWLGFVTHSPALRTDIELCRVDVRHPHHIVY